MIWQRESLEFGLEKSYLHLCVTDRWRICLLRFFYYFASRKVQTIAISVSVYFYVSVRDHLPEIRSSDFTNFRRMLPVTVARSFFVGVLIRYVLPVLWSMSFFSNNDQAFATPKVTDQGQHRGRCLLSTIDLFRPVHCVKHIRLFFRGYFVASRPM